MLGNNRITEKKEAGVTSRTRSRGTVSQQWHRATPSRSREDAGAVRLKRGGKSHLPSGNNTSTRMPFLPGCLKACAMAANSGLFTEPNPNMRHSAFQSNIDTVHASWIAAMTRCKSGSLMRPRKVLLSNASGGWRYLPFALRPLRGPPQERPIRLRKSRWTSVGASRKNSSANCGSCFSLYFVAYSPTAAFEGNVSSDSRTLFSSSAEVRPQSFLLLRLTRTRRR